MFPYFSLDKLDAPGLLYSSSTFETIFHILAHRNYMGVWDTSITVITNEEEILSV